MICRAAMKTKKTTGNLGGLEGFPARGSNHESNHSYIFNTIIIKRIHRLIQYKNVWIFH